MMAERGLTLAHTTIMRWVRRFVPEFEKRWNRFARPSGRSWHVDETYVKIRGVWHYLYRAVDREGNTVDFRLSPHRDVKAAKALFPQGARDAGAATEVDHVGWLRRLASRDARAGCRKPALERYNAASSKYLNNMIGAGSPRREVTHGADA